MISNSSVNQDGNTSRTFSWKMKTMLIIIVGRCGSMEIRRFWGKHRGTMVKYSRVRV